VFGCSVGALLISPLGHNWGFIDLAVYRMGASAVLHGAHLYDVRFPGDLAFTYPPFAAVGFTALTVLPLQICEALVTVISLLSLALVMRWALQLTPASHGLTDAQLTRLALVCAAVALWTEPVWSALRYGQVDVIIAALVLFDLSRRDGARAKGVGIGLAAGLKLTPAIFALYLLLTRRTRAAATSLMAFAATAIVGATFLPRDSGQFWSEAVMDPSRVGRIENAANQSLRGGFARVLHSLQVEPLWILTALPIGVVGMALAVRAGRRGEEGQGFALCSVTGLLVSPISWSHHWVLVVPALAICALAAYRRRSRAGLAATALLAVAGVSHVIWWVPVGRRHHAELHLDPAQLLFADTYLLIGVGAVALALVGAIQRARRAPADGGAPVSASGAPPAWSRATG
jgi:hypothetical protein